MGRRTILLIAALVVAALGTTLVFLYAHNANKRAQADQSPVQVLVAKTDVAAGTTGSAAQAAGDFQLKTLPKSAVAPGALSSITPVENQVALATIFTGQQVVSQMFGATASTESSSLPIPKGRLAASFQLGDPARVAGFVEPGSNVAVFVTLTPQGGQPETRILLPRSEVIAAGPTTLVSAVSTDSSGNQNTEQLPKALLTLALTQSEAQKVIYASSQGQIYFGLLTASSGTRPGGPTNSGNLFN